jgi:hypothetical protein
LGARGWVCIGFCNWRWIGLFAGSVVVVMTEIIEDLMGFAMVCYLLVIYFK